MPLSFLLDPEYWRSVRDTATGYANTAWDRAKSGKVILTGEPLDEAAARYFAPENAMNVALDISSPMNSLGGLAGIFAGKGAKIADLVKMAQAEDMLKAGVDPALVWKDLHWAKDPSDGKMKFEISDDAAVLKQNPLNVYQKESDIYGYAPQHETSLNAMLSHENFRGAYPDIHNSARVRVGDMRGSQGSMSYDIDGNPIIGLSTDAGKSTTLHELQHAIQEREGFARGGSPKQFKSTQEINETKNLAQQVAERGTELFNNLPDNLKNAARIINRGEDIDGAAYRAIAADPKARAIWADYVNAQSQVKELLGGPQTINMLTPSDQYRRLAGEAEARLTQARMAMTPEQRLAQYPYDPAYFEQATGVPLNSLIVRGEGGKAMSISDYPIPSWNKSAKSMVSFPVGENPTKAELEELFSHPLAKDTMVRGIKYQSPETKKMYLWPADAALHQDVGNLLGLDPRYAEHIYAQSPNH